MLLAEPFHVVAVGLAGDGLEVLVSAGAIVERDEGAARAGLVALAADLNRVAHLSRLVSRAKRAGGWVAWQSHGRRARPAEVVPPLAVPIRIALDVGQADGGHQFR